MKTLFPVLLLAALVSFPAFAFAADAEAGRERAATCLGCHGVPSYTNVYPSYHVPKLAGQYAEYIVAALEAYRSGARKHSTMRAQAHTLSDEDIQNVAAYFAALDSAPPNPEVEVSEALLEKVGVCAACHGNDGSSIAPAFPRIGGQHRDYLYHTLQGYKSGARDNPIMLGIVEALNEEDMRILAKYFSRQPGLGSVQGERFLKR